MKHLLSFGLLLLLSTTTSWSQDSWVKVIGGGSWDKSNSLTTTEDGGFVLTGNTESDEDDFEGMNKGGHDIFVIKLNSNGEVLWNKTFGGSRTDHGCSITTTEDGGVILTGLTYSNDGDFEGIDKGDMDIFVIKLNSNGEVLWEKTYGGSGEDHGNSLTTTADGGVILMGETYSDDGDFAGISKGERDIFSESSIFVIKLNSNGEVLWKKTFGGSSQDFGIFLTTTEDGEIVLTGGTTSNDGDFEGMKKGEIDIFIIKLNSLGKVEWKKTLGGSGEEWGYSLTTTEDGGVVLTGWTYSNDGDFKGVKKGGVNTFVIKLNSNGDIVWKKIFGGSRDDRGVSIITTIDGGVVLTGYTDSNDGDFKGMSKGQRDIFVIKLNSNGDIVWKKTYGGMMGEEGTSLTTTEDGGVVLTGYTDSDDGLFKGRRQGYPDIFVIKLDKDGNLKPKGKKSKKK